MSLLKRVRSVHWTSHARAKMMFYRLTEGRVRRVLHSPERIEEGIAPDTIAIMQTQRGPKKSQEIWVMVADTAAKRKIISAWRYPGVTKPGEALPKEIQREFRLGLAVIKDDQN